MPRACFSCSCTFVAASCFKEEKQACIKLSLVLGLKVFAYTSLMPAISSIFLHSFSTHNPVPLAAGINMMRAEPHFPAILKGIEWGCWQEQSQAPQPLLIAIILSLAFLTAFSRAGMVSF